MKNNPTIHEFITPSLSPKPGEDEPATPKRLVAPDRSDGGNEPINPTIHQSITPSLSPTPRGGESTTPALQHSISPSLSRLPRRKVAQLPQRTRDSINAMIRDCVPL